MGLDILSVLDSELGTGGGKEMPGWLRSVTTLQRPQPNWGGGHPLHHNMHEPTEDEFGAQGRCLRDSKSRPGKGSGSGGDPRQVVLDREACWGGGQAGKMRPPVGYAVDTWDSAPLGPFEKL